MSLTVTLPSSKTVTVRGKSITTDTLVVEKVVDVPEKNLVLAVIKDLGRIKLVSLSGKNYNNPDWTDTAVQSAVLAQLGG